MKERKNINVVNGHEVYLEHTGREFIIPDNAFIEVKEKITIQEKHDIIMQKTADIAIANGYCKHATESEIITVWDENLKFLDISEISLGDFNRTDISFKKIFTFALLTNAKYMVALHNHPITTKAHPSEPDKISAQKINQAMSNLWQITPQHMVIGADGSWQGYTTLFMWTTHSVKGCDFSDT